MPDFELNPYEGFTANEVAYAIRQPLSELIVKEKNPTKKSFLEKVLSTLKEWYD